MHSLGAMQSFCSLKLNPAHFHHASESVSPSLLETKPVESCCRANFARAPTCHVGRAFPSEYAPRGALQVTEAVPGFHMNRLSASQDTATKGRIRPEDVVVRSAQSDEELEAAAWLRAKAFYAYPEERKFAGQLHQSMKAREEFDLLKIWSLEKRLERLRDPRECVVAVVPLSLVSATTEVDRNAIEDFIVVTEESGEESLIIGTLDVVVAKAVDGQVLIGNTYCPAYLANVCVGDVVRRCGVGHLLIDAARRFAKDHDSDGLFVHIMAANEVGRKFYESCGFVVDKIESTNEANIRGHCLDGIPGGGKTMLLRDDQN
ncbi:hypothetical protein BSKO_01926 [Bryopsis sp. KO-2023]|nr:hypothetical protein BSKO_01926 [Bryopsis sp. KO-2023]